jgi:predicted Ser/Thr protein kinase
MSAGGDPNGLDHVVRAIQTRHPGIADDIQGAIDTLRKLQQITGTLPPPAANGRIDPARLNEATADGLSVSATPANGRIDPALLTEATTDGLSVPAPPRNGRVDPALLTEATTDGLSVLSAPVDETDPQFTRDAAPAARRDVPVLAPNESFGRYQIVRLLGKGAMGAVYLAYDPELERHVAMKTPFVGDNPQVIQRFYREARSAAQVRSPYVCPVYDVGHLGGIYFISMAFIEGQPLGRLIAGGQLNDLRVVAELAKKIARGLHKAHEQGIIHRDLKPDNIMIDAEGEPIIMDFGLARRADEESQLTAAGKLFGTPAYMSPEQVDADPSKVGPSSDIYSLGVVLFQMLTGRLPFQGSLTSILRQIGSDEPPRPSSIVAEIGAGSQLEQVCLKMMAKLPADRYPGTAEVIAALDDVFPRAGAVVAEPSLFARLWARLIRLVPFAATRAGGEPARRSAAGAEAPRKTSP